jgi:hypothetical protein
MKAAMEQALHPLITVAIQLLFFSFFIYEFEPVNLQ